MAPPVWDPHNCQDLLHWKPLDGFGALPNEGDKYQDDDSGNEVEISASHWDEWIDTTSNVNWCDNFTYFPHFPHTSKGPNIGPDTQTGVFTHPYSVSAHKTNNLLHVSVGMWIHMSLTDWVA